MTRPQVVVHTGRLEGIVEEGVASFRGIPFAASPTGDLRFLAPQRPPAWEGTRDASVYGPVAPQPGDLGDFIGGHQSAGDDYLNLNVHTPDSGGSGLPVLVWIHGGAYLMGAAEGPGTRGFRFARGGIVCVTVHYRLAAEGFLEMEGAPSNRAVLDWMAALEWVQENIASFGGDPSQVTIMGESAGSGACGFLMCEPRTRGLFRRSICMSGLAEARMPREAAAELSQKVAAHLGCRAVREDFARFTPTELIDAFGAVAPNLFDPARLVSAFDETEMGLRPFVDGEVITVEPRREFSAGGDGHIELLAGSTTEEMNGLVKWQSMSIGEDGARRTLQEMGLDDAKQEGYLRALGAPNALVALEQATTDRFFRGPLGSWLEARLDAPSPTYAYQFAWPSPLGDGFVGACHALDLAFAFDCLDAVEKDPIGMVLGSGSVRGDNPPQSVADDMHSALASFVTRGDPGWPRYERDRRAAMVFDVPSTVADDPLSTARTYFPL